MNKKKYPRRRYKKKKRYGGGLLEQDKWSRYLTKQKGGLLPLLVPFLARELSNLGIRL